MCGVASIVGRGALAVGTGGISEVANEGIGIARGTGQGPLGTTVTRLLGIGGGNDYSPQMLPQGDPKLQLAQSGGAPLLTQIVLGANVDDALAGYFGKASGADFKQYYASLKPEDKSAIDSVKNQLTQIQSNTDLRNKAVQQVVNDFPNIANDSIQRQKAAYADALTQYKQGNQEALAAFDSSTKAVLDQASNQLAAKYASAGGFSSGAFNAGLARAATDVGVQRGNLAAGYASNAAGLGYQGATEIANNQVQADYMGQQLRLGEVNALRGFQQTMLGQGVTQGFSASQAALNRAQQTGEFNANVNNQAQMFNQQQEGAMFGALGGLAGTVAGAYIGGPLGASLGGQIGKMAGGGGAYMGTGQGGYGSYGTTMNANAYGGGYTPRLNINPLGSNPYNSSPYGR